MGLKGESTRSPSETEALKGDTMVERFLGGRMESPGEVEKLRGRTDEYSSASPRTQRFSNLNRFVLLT